MSATPRDPAVALASRASRGASRGHAAILLLSVAILLAAIAAGVAFGTESISLPRALFDDATLDRAIALRVRLPRVLLAVIAGGGLAVVGAAFQAVLRNPLAEPYILGVSGGAAFGATMALVLGVSAFTILGASVVPLAAFAGGLAATALVYTFAFARARSSPSQASILLAGIVVNAIASAAITFIKTLVTATKAQELLYWLMGFIDVPSATTLVAVGAYVTIGCAVLFADAARLNVLALGDEPAEHLGVNVRALERRTFLVGSLIVGAIVSATGLIGFVGLVVPHGLRRIVGPDARLVLPLSLVCGGTVLVVCDLGSRILFRLLHTEPPVGAITALVGGPIFLALLRRRPT